MAAIDEAVRLAQRPAGSVTLVAVTKTQPAAHLQDVLAAGHRCFGENRVQEAQGKWPALKAAFPDIRLHLIGPLQTNKVRDALGLFDVIESVDRPRLAEALAEALAKGSQVESCLIQVNVGDEPQKAGIDLSEADRFIEACRSVWCLPVTGLMCIPPLVGDPLPHFQRLARLAADHGLEILSMGMSGDFPLAIKAGATHVRVGSALFGSRPVQNPSQFGDVS
jgi:pyridoxal phosphate enzyme (YggS family)